MDTKQMERFIEDACRAWWDCHLSAGHDTWDKLVSEGDHRLRGWRRQMRAALNAVGFFDLVMHHAGHHPKSDE